MRGEELWHDLELMEGVLEFLVRFGFILHLTLLAIVCIIMLGVVFFLRYSDRSSKRKRVQITMDSEILECIDACAAEWGVPRSTAIEFACELVLGYSVVDIDEALDAARFRRELKKHGM